MEAHAQVPVKVNAMVDEGIAQLVEALSAVPGLVTLESCQGGNGRDAYVIFRLGNWQEAGRFMFETLLPAMSDDLRSVSALRLQAYDAAMAQGEISVDPCAIPLLVQCITEMRSGSSVSPRALMARDAHGKTVGQTVIATSCN